MRNIFKLICQILPVLAIVLLCALTPGSIQAEVCTTPDQTNCTPVSGAGCNAPGDPDCSDTPPANPADPAPGPANGADPAPGPANGADPAPGPANGADPAGIKIGIYNPLKAKTLQELSVHIIELLIQLGIPVIIFMIIYAGFLYVTARGNPEQISKAHSTLLWTLVGAAVLLGAMVIVEVVQKTIDAIAIPKT